MIQTELYDGQGLGNQLWTYVVARIIADRNHQPYSIIGSNNFKGREFMTLDFGTVPETPLANYYIERKEYLNGTDIDISRTDPLLLTLPPNTRFDGNCQSTVYLEGYREKIISWLSITKEYIPYVDQDTCVIHVRCGDFTNQKEVFLPASYYHSAMDYLRGINPNIQFCIVTDQKEKAQQLLPGITIIGASASYAQDTAKAAHHFGGPIGIDFSLMVNAAYLIIPNSSLSWWAAYLNTKKKAVVAPTYWARYNVSDGYWSTSDIITEGFTYLDRTGVIRTAEACWCEKEAYEAAHPGIFSNTPTIAKNGLLARIVQTVWKKLR